MNSKSVRSQKSTRKPAGLKRLPQKAALDTERKQMEEALRQSEWRNKTISEQITDYVFVVDVLPKGRLKMSFVSDSFTRLTGRTLQEAADSQLWNSIIHPEDLPRFYDFVRHTLTSAQAGDIECRTFTKQGSERWVKVYAKPHSQPGKGVTSIVGAVQDITERKKAEINLLEIQEDLNRAQAVARTGSWKLEILNNTLHWSRETCRLFGVAEGSPQPYESFLASVHPEDLAAVDQAYKRALAGAPFDIEHRIIVNGETRWVRERAEMKHDKNGRLFSVLGVVQDITENKLARIELEQSRKQLRDLLARMQHLREDEQTRIAREVHDVLGQQITALKLDLAWCQRRFQRIADLELQRQLQDKFDVAFNSLTSMMQTVRTISRKLRPTMLDDLGLEAVIHSETQAFQDRSGIACSVKTPSTGLTLPAEHTTGIFRIFQEILTNVARHANATRVQISLTSKIGILLLKVSDNGCGIRTEEIHDPKSLGLLGMHERAALMGGRLSIEAGRKTGTTVILTVPIAQTQKTNLS